MGIQHFEGGRYLSHTRTDVAETFVWPTKQPVTELLSRWGLLRRLHNQAEFTWGVVTKTDDHQSHYSYHEDFRELLVDAKRVKAGASVAALTLSSYNPEQPDVAGAIGFKWLRYPNVDTRGFALPQQNGSVCKLLLAGPNDDMLATALQYSAPELTITDFGGEPTV